MTAEGATRKATGRALFSKLLYIAESEEIVAQESEAAKGLSVPEVMPVYVVSCHVILMIGRFMLSDVSMACDVLVS
jgi:hypothetical protein